MRISTRALNRATLDRQMLLQRESLDITEAVRRVVAVQAQHPASPYLALWNRVANFDPAALDAAFSAYTIVKSNMLRMTLHAVHTDDYQPFREATEPTLRAARLYDDRFTMSGLTAADADTLVPDLLDFAAEPRTAAEYQSWLAVRLPERMDAPLEPRAAGAWWGLRQYAPLLRAPSGGPWSFDTRPLFVAARTRPTLANLDASAETLRTLIRRYLAGFGPGSVADMALFALVQRARAKAAVQALLRAGEIEQLEGPNGEALYDIPGASLPSEDTPAPPRLLGMWDNVLLAHVDRSRVIPAEYRKHVTRVNGDVLPTLLIDGYVAGVWRAVEGGIEATAFHPLPEGVWDGLAAEARTLLVFLSEREAQVYSRYGYWWAKMSGVETRLLPGD